MRTYSVPTALTTIDTFVALPFNDPGVTGGLVIAVKAPEAQLFGGIIKNTGGSNAIKWQLIGVQNGHEYVVDSGAAIAAGAVDSFEVLPYFTEYRVEVAANAGGSQSTVTAELCLK